jgi:hypothetical protein
MPGQALVKRNFFQISVNAPPAPEVNAKPQAGDFINRCLCISNAVACDVARRSMFGHRAIARAVQFGQSGIEP